MHKKTKYAALLLSFALILWAALGMTLAVVFVKTPSLINTFLSGFEPTGDLTIRKTIHHPFDSSYVVPDNENTCFTFTVDLGMDYANHAFGTFRADPEGKLTLTVKAGSSVTIPELPAGIQAVVTEQAPGPGFEAQEPRIVAITRGENLVSVVNTYAPGPADNDLTVQGRKTLVGRQWQAGDRFTFALEVKEEGQWKELGQQTVEFTGESDPEDFDTFDFTRLVREYTLDKAGTYSFRVLEKEGSIPGITYDKTESRFEVAVGDPDMAGSLQIRSVTSRSANTSVRNRQVWIDFQNAYAPLGSVEVYLDITKELTDTSGQNLQPSGFTFELYDAAGKLLQTSEATDAEGRTEIRLVFETKDSGRRILYTLKEVNDGLPGMTYDEREHIFQVDVIYTGNGTVSARVTEVVPEPPVPQEEEAPVSQEPEAPEMEGSPEDVPTEEAPAEEEPPVEEEDPPVPEEPVVRASVSFTNVYEPKAATLPLSGTKQLTGRRLQPEEFAFQLYRTQEGFALAEDAVPLQTVRNDANGAFAFQELTFTQAGWHYFLVKEDASAALGGVTYDDARFQIRVFVKDVGGKLSVQEMTVENTAGEAAELTFRNVYRSAPAALKLEGRKSLSGRELKAEEFTFNLYEATYLTSYGFTRGQLYARSTNSAEGLFDFSIEYPEPGTFHYIVTEVAGQESGMAYDKTEYGLEIVVKDDLAGHLRAEVTRLVKIGQEDASAEEILFRNIYTAPEETEPVETTEPKATQPGGSVLPDDTDETTEASGGKLPQTGQLWWPVPVLLILGIAFILIGLIRRRGACHED